MSRFLAALLAAPLLAFSAANAQVGGYVVPDPYADLPPIQLPEPVQESVPPPRHAPPAGVLPKRQVPALTPGEALGIIIRDHLVREFDRVLPGARDREYRWRGERRLYDGRWRRRGRDDDDDRDDDD